MHANQSKTIMEHILERFEELTRAERKLANILLEDYPVSALGSITEIAIKADISTPTVARMISKLGFDGFPQFQQAIRTELKAKISNPIEKHDSWSQSAPDTHILNQFTETVSQNIRRTLGQTDPQEFDRIRDMMLCNEDHIYITGGRITHSIAEYFFTHLQMIRPNVTLLSTVSNGWSHQIIDMKKNDLLFIFDIRRYENNLLRLAQIAHDRKMKIILFSDQWSSPISKYAKHTFNCHIEVPSAWDSCIVIALIIEALIAGLQEKNWTNIKDRMNTLEDLFDRTSLFRKLG